MKRVITLTAVVMAGALILNAPGIHIHHDLTLPTFDKSRISSSENFSLWSGNVKNSTIRLGTEILEPEKVKDITQTLQDAETGDTITFHLAGYGGRYDTLVELVNNIKLSKARIIMMVDAPVYSAHAMLAAAGDELYMAPDTFLMFHAAATSDGKMTSQVDCNEMTGTDRGVSNIWHCEAAKTAQMTSEYRTLKNIKLLTEKDFRLIINGYDVYIFPEDLKDRKIGR